MLNIAIYICSEFQALCQSLRDHSIKNHVISGRVLTVAVTREVLMRIDLIYSLISPFY